VAQTDAHARPPAGRVCVACARAAGLHAGKRPIAKVEPDGQGTAQDVVAFTSSHGKFRTGMYRAGPEHQEYKSGYASNEFISWLACRVQRRATMRSRSPGSILPAVKNRGQNVPKTAQIEQAMLGDYLRDRAARRFAGTPLRCLVTGFVVSAASSACRNPCSNSSTAFPKAPSCPARTIATDGCKSNDGGRNIFTVSIE
jgi:hypothetical protein